MEIQEYPKAVYRDGVHKEVQNAEEEAAAADDGFTDWHSDHAKLSGKADADGDEPAEMSHTDMKAKATELGLTFAHNISKTKLAELLAAA